MRRALFPVALVALVPLLLGAAQFSSIAPDTRTNVSTPSATQLVITNGTGTDQIGWECIGTHA